MGFEDHHRSHHGVGPRTRTADLPTGAPPSSSSRSPPSPPSPSPSTSRLRPTSSIPSTSSSGLSICTTTLLAISLLSPLSIPSAYASPCSSPLPSPSPTPSPSPGSSSYGLSNSAWESAGPRDLSTLAGGWHENVVVSYAGNDVDLGSDEASDSEPDAVVQDMDVGHGGPDVRSTAGNHAKIVGDMDDEDEDDVRTEGSWMHALRNFFRRGPAPSDLPRPMEPEPEPEPEPEAETELADPHVSRRRTSEKAWNRSRRRREGDEQDIAGLGKARRGRYLVGRAEEEDERGHPEAEPVGSSVSAPETHAEAVLEPGSNSSSTTTTTTTNTVTSPLPLALTTALPLDGSFPLPLDSTLSYSLGNSCVAFLTRFLTSDEMAGDGSAGEEGACKPFGMLLGSSSGWASLLRQPDQLNPALSQICHPASASQSDECSAYFETQGREMVKQGNCRDDLVKGNTVAMSVYRGFQFYEMMQQAACLQDEGTGAYCYLEAVAADRPDDAYLWSLPGGNILPSTTQPTCSTCSKALLNLYSNSTNPKASSDIPKSAYGPGLKDTVGNVSSLFTDRCGAGFLDVNMASAATNGAEKRGMGVRPTLLVTSVVAGLIAALT